MNRKPPGSPSVPPRAARALGVLRGLALDTTAVRESHDFRLLFTGQAINLVGGQIRMVTIPYLVYLMTRSSLVVGLLSLAQFLPAVVFALAGGALADAIDRRRLLLVTQVLLAICSALLAGAALIGATPLWYIFGVVAIAAGIQAVDQPARRAAIPRLVGRDQIANALAINQIVNQMGTIAGPAIAGLILARFGIGPGLVIDTLTFVVSIGAIFLMAPMPPALDGGVAPKSGVAAIVEGLAFLKGKPVLLSTFLIDINATFFGGPKALFPALATDVFRTGPVGLGLLYAAPGVGAVVGALLTGWVNKVRRQGLAVIVSVCVWGAAITIFGLLTRAFWLALVFLAISGAANMISAVFRATILQLAVPDRLRGRLSAIHFMVVTSGPRLGDLEAGTVATLASTEFSVVSGGLLALAGTFLIAFAIPAFARFDASKVPEELVS